MTDVLTVDKDRFPTRRVYGPTAGAELHLITCGGDFDRRSGHYLRNVVVSGLLVDPELSGRRRGGRGPGDYPGLRPRPWRTPGSTRPRRPARK